MKLSTGFLVVRVVRYVGQAQCDRACLEGLVDRYLDAVVAHDPSKAPIAKNAKFTENGQKLDVGDGLWNTMSGKGTYRLFVTDPQAGEVSFLGSIREDNTPAMLALRLESAESPDLRDRDFHSAQRPVRAGVRENRLCLDRNHSSGRTHDARRTDQDREHVFLRHAEERRQGRLSFRRRLQSH